MSQDGGDATEIDEETLWGQFLSATEDTTLLELWDCIKSNKGFKEFPAVLGEGETSLPAGKLKSAIRVMFRVIPDDEITADLIHSYIADHSDHHNSKSITTVTI